MGPVTETPTATDKVLTAADGAQLPLHIWLAETPGKNPRAVIIALHGFNDYSNAFYLLAPWWAKQGVTTYAYDQRGFGGAPHRGFWPGTQTLTADLRAAVHAIRARHPEIPIYVLGVSMGGRLSWPRSLMAR